MSTDLFCGINRTIGSLIFEYLKDSDFVFFSNIKTTVWEFPGGSVGYGSNIVTKVAGLGCCYGKNSIPGPETLVWCGHSQKNKKIIKKKQT